VKINFNGKCIVSSAALKEKFARLCPPCAPNVKAECISDICTYLITRQKMSEEKIADELYAEFYVRRPNMIKAMIREVLQKQANRLAERLIDNMTEFIMDDISRSSEVMAEIIKDDPHGWMIRDNALTTKAKTARKQCKKKK